LGNQAAGIRQFAHGIDERPLIPAREPQKTFSHQETFGSDLTDEDYVEATLRRMADSLFAKVREEGRSIRTLTVKVRYNDMAEDQLSESLIEPTDLETDVYGVCTRCCGTHGSGVSVSGWSRSNCRTCMTAGFAANCRWKSRATAQDACARWRGD
jgi:hypothetical protein